MNVVLNSIEIILFIVFLIISVILMYKVSEIVRRNGYSSSIGTNPSEIFDFITIIRNEKNKKEKWDYIIILIAYFFFIVLTFILAYIIF